LALQFDKYIIGSLAGNINI